MKSAQERWDQLETYGAAFEPNVFDPAPLTCFSSATPTAAPAADQSTSLSSPLALLFLPFQYRIPWRILSIPPAPALLDQGVIDVRVIRQEHIGKGAPVLILAEK